MRANAGMPPGRCREEPPLLRDDGAAVEANAIECLRSGANDAPLSIAHTGNDDANGQALNNSTLSGNASGADGSGGALDNSGTLTLNKSTLSGNQATFGGTGISNSGTTTAREAGAQCMNRGERSSSPTGSCARARDRMNVTSIRSGR